MFTHGPSAPSILIWQVIHSMPPALARLLRQQFVLLIAAAAALVSMLFVPPSPQYLDYLDMHSLSLLFCLMAVVAGFQRCGVLDALVRRLLSAGTSLRLLSVLLVLFSFFLSMLVTNDVALLTLVPLSILLLSRVVSHGMLIRVLVLQTMAANLGSMATPIGNPQNLYLFSAAGLSAGQFARAVLPYAAVSLVLLLAALLLQPAEPLGNAVPQDGAPPAPAPGKLLPFLGLLALCLLVVFRLLPYGAALAAVILVVLAVDRKLFRSVDYFLLLTFLCFFIFIGNLKRIPEVNGLLRFLVEGHELWAGILGSQIISNVPAAILLSGFTEDYAALLTAVNLGGLGTLIASLASLISFKFFSAAYPQRKGRYLGKFTLWNLLFLAVLTGEALLLM